MSKDHFPYESWHARTEKRLRAIHEAREYSAHGFEVTFREDEKGFHMLISYQTEGNENA